jgi:hypothetical protein
LLFYDESKVKSRMYKALERPSEAFREPSI